MKSLRLKIQPEKFEKFIWIPHRPVIKNTELVTTKIRPASSYSLKTLANYSLNEAAYPGINLIKILLKFRMNKFVMLVDMRGISHDKVENKNGSEPILFFHQE